MLITEWTMKGSAKDIQLSQRETGRRQRRRLETKERLFRAAMKLFAERGFAETTTEAITNAADVGQGTFFNYFPTKPHVLTVLTEIQMGKVGAARVEAESGQSTIHDVCHRLTYSITEEIGRSPELTRALLSAFLSNQDVRVVMGNAMTRAREELSQILALGQRTGEVRRSLKPEHMALAFQRGVIGTMLLWAISEKGQLRDWLEKAFHDFWEISAAAKG
jgi:AcrR family transcriptional regulator